MLLISIFISVFFNYVSTNGYYQVIGPKTLRPLSEYHVSVSIEGTSGPTLVRAIVEGVSFNGSIFTVEDDKEILPFNSELFTLKIPFISPGAYKLQVQGRGSLDFLSYYPLDFLEKSYSVLIETDRAIYNPGSVVRFRVIVLDPQLKPVGKLQKVTVKAVDNDKNVIKIWKNIKTERGVFSGDFKLSKNPVLGNWNITAEIQGQEYFKTIRIARYILPAFKIEIDSKEHITFQEGKIIAQIRTNYHHGKTLEGEVTVSAFPTIFSHVIQPIFQNPVRRIVSTEGSVTVEFDIEKDLRLNDEYERIVVLDVEVEEKLTGRRENISKKIHIHKYDHKIDLVKTSDYFKPGLKYVSYVKVARHDGMPLNANDEIVVRHGFFEEDKLPIERKHRLDKNGIAKLEYLAPTNVTNTTALRIEAQFGELKEKMSPVLTAVSYSNVFIQATLETERPLVNLEVEVSVICTEPMRSINYVIFGRGDVLTSKTILIENKKEVTFRFRATHAMVPLAHLIVSYIRDNGEMIGDSLDIQVDGLLQNFLEIRSSTSEGEPGFDVDIQMKSQPYSYVGLMAVDVKNHHLGNGYAISNSLVSNDLLSYDSAQQSEYLKITRDGKWHFPWRPGGSNIYSGIQDSGGDVLTNGHILRKKPTLNDIYLRPTIFDSSTVKPDRGFGLPIHSATRPPLAGPYAFSRIPTPVWNIPKVYLNEEIEDTWIFSNFSTRYDGVISTRKRMPNSLTNWMMSGFSLDPVYGLGIMSPKYYKTSKQFHIKLELPYSVHGGEALNVPVHIYNNMDKNIDVDVTLHNVQKNFEFTSISNEVSLKKSTEMFQKERTKVNSNSNGTVWFMITPVKVGSTEIKVTATNPFSQDSISEFILVKAEGETEYYAKSELLDLRQKDSVKKTINFTIPKNAISGSEKIEVACVGNIFGPTLRHLDEVIRKPTGCGEQNLLFMMTSVIVLKYLQTSKLNKPEIYNKAVDYLDESYQNQLAFKREDNAFSVFGSRDKQSSVWITAYTLLAFRQAAEYIPIDEKVLEKGYEWLSNIQSRNGSFHETGNEIHVHMQNKSGYSLPLTSFVLMSFLENQKYTIKYKNTINKGLDYIARYMDESEDTYSIALCSYILQITKHPSKQSAFNLLDNRAKYKDNMKWWSRPMPIEKNNIWNDLPNSINIEMTSYALLSFLEENLLEDSMPVLNWLLKQQNDIGGFSSSQDTVMALQALFKLVNKLSFPSNIQIEFSYTEKESGKFHITQNDAITEQKFEIDEKSREVNVTAKGRGLGVFKVYYRFNKDVTGPWPKFILDPQVDKNSNRDHIQLSICVRLIKDKNIDGNTTSNMAVMEVNLPSGYTVDTHSLPSLEVSQHVQKVEAKNKLSKVILYFHNISSAIEYCPTVSAFRTHKVANHKPVPVILYDYYDTSRRARIFYRPPTTTVCDICTDVDCESACVIEPKPQIREGVREGKSTKNEKNKSKIMKVEPFLIIFLILLTTL